MAAIILSNAKVLANAPVGTVVGTFNASVSLSSNPLGYFKVIQSSSGQSATLVTAWSGSAVPGMYLVLVSAGGGTASFRVEVVDSPLVPIVTLATPVITVADNSVAFGKLSDFSVSMSDGSVFSGVLAVSSGPVRIFGSRLVLAWPLTVADDGVYTVTLTASQGGATGRATLTVRVVAPPPPPPTVTSVAFAPSSPQVTDTVPIGTVVSQTVVAMSDGSAFNGTYSLVDATGLFTIDGAGRILTARAATSTDDGARTVTVTVTTPAGAVASARFPVAPGHA